MNVVLGLLISSKKYKSVRIIDKIYSIVIDIESMLRFWEIDKKNRNIAVDIKTGIVAIVIFFNFLFSNDKKIKRAKQVNSTIVKRLKAAILK